MTLTGRGDNPSYKACNSHESTGILMGFFPKPKKSPTGPIEWTTNPENLMAVAIYLGVTVEIRSDSIFLMDSKPTHFCFRVSKQYSSNSGRWRVPGMKMDDNPRFGTSSSMKVEPFRHPSRDTFRGRKRKKTGGSNSPVENEMCLSQKNLINPSLPKSSKYLLRRSEKTP